MCTRAGMEVVTLCVSVCAANLFIYLSLAAIMVFIPSLSLSVSVYLVMGDWVSCVSLDYQTCIFSSDSNQTNYTRDGERGQVDVGER